MKRFFAVLILLFLVSLPLSIAVWSQSQHSATISWSYVQGSDPATGFNVYRSTTVGGTYTQINTTVIPITTLSFVDTSVTAGATYFYTVDAQDANGIHSSQSTPVQGIIPGNPNIPASVTVTTK